MGDLPIRGTIFNRFDIFSSRDLKRNHKAAEYVRTLCPQRKRFEHFHHDIGLTHLPAITELGQWRNFTCIAFGSTISRPRLDQRNLLIRQAASSSKSPKPGSAFHGGMVREWVILATCFAHFFTSSYEVRVKGATSPA